MPVDYKRLQLFLVGISVVSAEQQLATVELDSDVCLSTTNVTAVSGH